MSGNHFQPVILRKSLSRAAKSQSLGALCHFYKPYMTNRLNRVFLTLGYTFGVLSYSACTPPFDSTKPDTKNNQFHYEHLLHVEMSPDVKNLYSYGDEGFDASYNLAFKCNLETAKRIIISNNLVKDTGKGNPLISGFKQHWWNETEIDTLTRYIYTNDDRRYFKYFWYNETNLQAYFLDFDL